MNSIYVTSARPRLPAASEVDLQQAVDNQLLEETHFLDLKREVKSGKGENKELARDLSSFAIDSGTLVIGVEEHNDGSVSLAPQPLSGLPERIEQVAATIPDPPLAVISNVIPTAADPSVGYVVVHVPASPMAPHMVDNRYVGRGDKTKRYLSDPEVLRLHERRRSAEVDIVAALDEQFRRDPVAPAASTQAHLFLIARPLTPHRDMLLHLTDGSGWQSRLHALAQRGLSTDVSNALGRGGIVAFSPDAGRWNQFDLRPRGAALTSSNFGPGRVLRSEDDLGTTSGDSLTEFEVDASGELRMYMSRLSAQRRSERTGQYRSLCFESAAVIYVRRLCAIAFAAAEEAGYFGNWAIAMGATGLRGTSSFAMSQSVWEEGGVPYIDDEYREGTLATYAELSKRPGAVTDRLVSPFLRGFGTRQLYAGVFNDTP